MSNKDKDTEKLSIDYNLNLLAEKKWLIVLTFIFVYSILSVIPFQKKIDNFVFSSLKALPGCSLRLSDYSLNFFPPGLEMKDLKVPGRCLQIKRRSLNFSKILLSFRGFSLSPLGPHFKVESLINQSPLTFFATYAGTKMAISFQNDNLNLGLIENFTDVVKLSGSSKINFYTLIESGNIKNLAVNISSKDLVLPTQKIKILTVPTLRLNNFLLQGKTDKNGNFELKNFVLGQENSPIRAMFKGKLTFNKRNLNYSTLDFKGETQFSDDFLNKFSIIKVYLNSFPKEDGFYKLKIKGPLAAPDIRSSI